MRPLGVPARRGLPEHGLGARQRVVRRVLHHPGRHVRVPVRGRVLKSDRTGLTAALRYRFTGPVRPVTGRNRLNSNPNSNKFKNSHTTGRINSKTPIQPVPTGLPAGFTGRFDRFEIQKLPCNRFTGRFDRFTSRFDRFDRWAFMGRSIFFFFFDLTLNPRKLY